MSTSSGGKTLLVPTPYSFKLALVDACIQRKNIEKGIRLFGLLRGRPVRISPPADAVVSATLIRLRKLERSDAQSDDHAGQAEDTADVRMFSPTVGFREYVSFSGVGPDAAFQIAIARSELDEEALQLLSDAARAVTYCGKRGGFLQCEAPAVVREIDELPATGGFTVPLSQLPEGGTPLGTIQPLDELASSAEWERVNTFGRKPVRVAHLEPGRNEWSTVVDRAYVPSAIPYRLVKSTRTFAAYRRIDVA